MRILGTIAADVLGRVEVVDGPLVRSGSDDLGGF